MGETTETAVSAAERRAAYAKEMADAAQAIAELAAAWAADPAAAAAVIRHRAAQRIADAPAPDSCAVLEGMNRAYATYADRLAADQTSVQRFEAADEAYRTALHRLEGTV